MISLNQSLTYETGSIVYHSIILLEGSVTDQLLNCIQIRNITTGCGLYWPVIAGCFKAFVILKPGANLISIKYGFYAKELTYNLSLRQSQYIVHPLYIIGKNSDGYLQGPEYSDCSPSAACRRIALGAGLMQTFTAMDMKLLNLTPSTFQLPLDNASGFPACTIFQSKYSNQEMYAMTDKDLWRCLAKEIMGSQDLPNRYTSKFLAFIACTRYDGKNWKQHWRHRDTVASTKGHIALGGGGLAVLGTGTLHTWAESLDTLVARFTDKTIIDSSKLMDDSAYRRTFWANFSTGLGAALHELGHTFDLSHTQTGIMSRGFDNIHRFFVLDNAQPVRQPAGGKSSKNAHQLDNSADKFSSEPVRRFCSITPILTFVCVPSISQTTCQATTVSHFKPSPMALSLVDTTQTQPRVSVQPIAGDGHLFGDVTQRTPDIDSDGCKEMAVSASSWSLESATMMRYCRWLMNDDEISRKSVGFKPVLTASRVEAPLGVRVIQIYHRCLDRIVYSRHHAPDNSILTAVSLSEIMTVQNESDGRKHVGGCRGGADCVFIHVRDSSGNFLSGSVPLI